MAIATFQSVYVFGVLERAPLDDCCPACPCCAQKGEALTEK